jgi:carboxyl-terminal processing protease
VMVETIVRKARKFPLPSLASLLAASLVFLSCARPERPDPSGLVDIGPHRLEMRREGTGVPTIVIDAGLSDTMEKLGALQTRLARKTGVLTYNRAGYGRSEPGPLPRDAGREAAELKALLEKASVPGPYVLVGHSLGGLNALVFAAEFPDIVAGLVLLDPPPLSFILGRSYPDLRAMAESMTAEWQATADRSASAADPRERAQSAFFRMIASEHREMFGRSARLVVGLTRFGDLPLTVIAAGKANPAFGAVAEQYQKYWIEQSRLLAGKSTQGKFVLAEKSGHHLYLDAPELVAREIEAVVDAARSRVPSPGDNGVYAKCFEVVWKTINERFFDPDFNGLDWRAAGDRYRTRVSHAESDAEFYRLINGMLFELGVSHIGVIPPDQKEQLEPIAAAGGSLGVDVRLIDGAAVVTSVEPGSPGEGMGLRPGFIIASLGGKTIAQWDAAVVRIPPLHERNERKRLTSKIQEQLYGRPGTAVSVVFRDAQGASHEAVGKMRPREGKVSLPGGQMPPFYLRFDSRRLGDLGGIAFDAFLPPADERFAEALLAFRDARGLIVDLRGNHGGVFPVRKRIVDRLVPERRLFWSYKGRDGIHDVFTEPRPGSYAGPVVVLVDVMSASSAEEVAGGLQSIGRATVIGQRTAGVCLVMELMTLPNGALFIFPVQQTRTSDGTVLENRGVIPDIEVKLDRAGLLRGVDSQMEAAVRFLRSKSPKGSE